MGAKTKIDDNGVERRVLWGGGARAFTMHCKLLDLLKIVYQVESEGAVKWLYQGDKNAIIRFVIKQDGDPRVGAACRMVLSDVRKYEEKNERIVSPYRTTYNKAVGVFTDYLVEGGRNLVLIDVKACYWTIIFKKGIISQKTYDKYLGDKLLRLIPVGNLNKAKDRVSIQGGEVINGSEKITYNYHSWVWHYVVFEAYELFKKVNKATNNQVFMFKTDCFYVSPRNAQKVRDAITKAGFTFTEENRTVIGHNRGRIVMENKKKEKKVSNFGLPRSVHQMLPFIEVDQSIYSEEERKDREDQSVEKHIAVPLKPSKEFDEIATPKAKKVATPKPAVKPKAKKKD